MAVEETRSGEDCEMPLVIVIPVKGGASAKSRLGGDEAFRAALARAMALDTIEAALAVAPVIVVTGPELAADAAALGATVVPDPGMGLNPAIEAGLGLVSTGSTHSVGETRSTGSTGSTHSAGATSAVLLGDLPGLDPRELRAALAAAKNERNFVADADGVGTVLTVARASHALRFGPHSREAHTSEGYVELLEPWPSLRRDVDLPQHLVALKRGARTLELLRTREGER